VHPHGQHKEVETECRCCGREERFVFTSPYDQVLCETCKRHTGDTPERMKRRDTDHIRQWRDDLLAWYRHYEDKIATMAEKVGGLEERLAEEVANRPKDVVYKHVGQDVLSEARAERDAAYDSRDWAMRALSDINRRHGEVEDHRCRCGNRLARCRDGQAIGKVSRGLEQWERKQVERLRRGLDTYRTTRLPEGHPALIDPHYGRSA
jgi:uncharacterized membrane-anchored protein